MESFEREYDYENSPTMNVGLVVVILAICASVSTAALPTEVDIPEVVWRISNMHDHPWFVEVMFASVAGWILGMVKGFSSSGDWLKNYLPSKPVLVVFLLDLLVFVVIGGYAGTGIYDPGSLLEAFAAGLSWPIGLGALTTKDKEE